MPANANIVINDGQTLPLAHTFVPMSSGAHRTKDATMAFVWEDKSPSTPEGFKSIALEYSSITKQRLNPRVALKIVDPKVETISINGGTATPMVTRAVQVDIVLTCGPKTTEAERKDAIAYAKNVLANSLVDSAFVKLELPY